MIQHNTARTLYKKLLTLYPKTFREQLAEFMWQTFNDLCKEKQETYQPLLIFIMWTFAETSVSILQENLLVIKEMNPMKNILTTLGSPSLVSLLLILPFMIMEVVNRRNFNEDFPFMLFFGLWLSLFTISLILLPIVRAKRTVKHDMANPVPTQANTLLTNPKSVLIISVGIVLFLAIVSLLDSLGGGPLESLINDTNPEQLYVFGVRVASQLIALVLFSLPIAAGIIASRPIVHTLRAGGSLFAHPINLIIVVVISFLFVAGVFSLILDQWPCFMGVPNCD